MFFIEPNRTPYDLRWRMFGTPVRVHPFFWLLTLLLGFNTLKEGFSHLFLWVGCVFVSILIHEFGHIIMGRIFGSAGHIVLYSFGGLAIGSNRLSTRWQRIAVLFAGPGAGVLFLALFFAACQLYDPTWGAVVVLEIEDFLGLPLDVAFLDFQIEHFPPPLVGYLIDYLVQVNLGWGLLNLLPIWPLDGGQISSEIFQWFNPRTGLRMSLGFSVLVAGFFAICALAAANGHPLLPFLKFKDGYLVFLFALLAFQSYQMMQQTPVHQGTRQEDSREPWGREQAPWERDADYWKR